MSLNIEILSKAANQARGLCMDAVQASQSGHLGLPLGCAEIGAVLFGHELKYNPDQPRWINRDIFVLSGGHGSMLLYARPHMSGYDLKAVTLDAAAKETQSEDTGKRMQAYGFGVQEIEGQDMQQFLDAFNVAKRRDNGKPQFIIADTLIGKGVPEVEGTYKAHGEAGAKFVDAARKALGLPDEHYFVSKDVYDYFAQHKKTLLAEYDRWEKTYDAWRAKNPDQAKVLDDGLARTVPPDLLSKIPEFPK